MTSLKLTWVLRRCVRIGTASLGVNDCGVRHQLTFYLENGLMQVCITERPFGPLLCGNWWQDEGRDEMLQQAFNVAPDSSVAITTVRRLPR